MRFLPLVLLLGCSWAAGQPPPDTDTVPPVEEVPPAPMAPAEPDLEEILLTLDPTQPVPDEVVDEVLGGSASGDRDSWYPPLEAPPAPPEVDDEAREAVRVILTVQDPADVVAIQQEQLQYQEQRVDELAADLLVIENRLRAKKGLPPLTRQEQMQDPVPPPEPLPAPPPPAPPWQDQVQYQEPPR